MIQKTPFADVLHSVTMAVMLLIVILQGSLKSFQKQILNSTKNRTVLAETSTGRECFSTELKRTQQIFFSPKDRYMITYEP